MVLYMPFEMFAEGVGGTMLHKCLCLKDVQALQEVLVGQLFAGKLGLTAAVN